MRILWLAGAATRATIQNGSIVALLDEGARLFDDSCSPGSGSSGSRSRWGQWIQRNYSTAIHGRYVSSIYQGLDQGCSYRQIAIDVTRKKRHFRAPYWHATIDVNTCCVGWTNRSGRGERFSFFKIPQVITHLCSSVQLNVYFASCAYISV